MSSLKLVAAFIGVGLLTGCIIALMCMAITLIAANPWVPVFVLGAVYGITGLAVQLGYL